MVTYREDLEEREREILSPLATLAVASKGRAYPEEPCVFRTAFQRDRDRIIHSKAFRRLMHKTQVFLNSEGDHYRTRLTHTLEVSQIARTIARALRLNEDLAEAIALGHDLGHTPFGHNGEAILNEIHPGGFRHNEQSLRVVDKLEKAHGHQGMNLTFEVRDGILNHSGAGFPQTLEGQIVRLSDRIAYINHDIDDALRSGVITFSDLPAGPIAVFGTRHSRRIDAMVRNVIEVSEGKDRIGMDESHAAALDELRTFMFANVYRSKSVKKEEDLMMVDQVVRFLYAYFVDHPEELPEDEHLIMAEEGVNVAVRDYVAGMTDRYAINTYHRLQEGSPTGLK
ncbi:MAG: deoxyguanosinetriphosphate triphosphohydrolase [Firmicutes bacterium]|nr:deoxyguanosinetriphosphate triphosphohydrolase [Bacillota bacterium]